MAGKLISDLNSGTLSLADAMEIDKDVSGTRTSFKTTVKDIVDFVNRNVADEYDNTSTYAIGDYVMYESTLYKCITAVSSAENFDSMKWTAVVVTDEMGSGGGGGTGGHTIIDENGTSMPSRAGLQFVGANVSDDATNNKTIVDLASAGGIDGVFIDTGNVIVQETQISASGLSYTATEDCFVYLYIWGSNSTSIKIGNVEVGANYSGDKDVYLIPLKKGQTLTTTSGNENNTYAVYGIQTGTTHSKFQPIIYSTEERVIGVWKDGRPLYEKTVDFGALPNNTTKTVSYNISDLDYFVKIQGIAHNQNGTRNIPFVDDVSKTGDVLLDTIKSSGVIRIIAHTDLSSLTGDVTLQYVKTTDVAGSGTWTPQGVPAVHYSMDEQVIGTYLGETLYQKSVKLPSSVTITTSWTDLGIVVSNNIANIIDGKLNRNGTMSFNASFSFDDTTKHIKAQTYFSNLSLSTDTIITLQYTKTS